MLKVISGDLKSKKGRRRPLPGHDYWEGGNGCGGRQLPVRIFWAMFRIGGPEAGHPLLQSPIPPVLHTGGNSFYSSGGSRTSIPAIEAVVHHVRRCSDPPFHSGPSLSKRPPGDG